MEAETKELIRSRLIMWMAGIMLGFCIGYPNGHIVGTLEGKVQSYERVIGDMQQLTSAAITQEKTPAARARVKLPATTSH